MTTAFRHLIDRNDARLHPGASHLARMLGSTLLAAALMTAFVPPAHADTPNTPPESHGTVTWHQGDVADLFAQAKATGRPILLYWGARWCPPCAQLRANVFPDPRFAAAARPFMLVHLDGDDKGAQAWGQRFHIAGYPTIILLRPDGTEITRQVGATSAAQLTAVMTAAAGRTTTTTELLDHARTAPQTLSSDDWRLLSAYPWGYSGDQEEDAAATAALLDKLAGHAPTPALQRRFALLAIQARIPDGKTAPSFTPAQANALPGLLTPVLADPAELHENLDLLSGAGADLVGAIPAAPARARLKAALLAAMTRAQTDPSLTVADRLGAVEPAIDFAKQNHHKVPPALLAHVQAQVAWADSATQSPMARQAVISSASQLLDDAGDRPGAQALLEAELKRSATPYYYMADLSDLAEEAGDHTAALDWSRRAAETADGAATRVQWSVLYAQTVLRLSPDDIAAVKASSGAVVANVTNVADDYHQRTQKRVARWATALRGWSTSHPGGPAVFAQVQAQMQPVCTAQTDPQLRAACTSTFR